MVDVAGGIDGSHAQPGESTDGLCRAPRRRRLRFRPGRRAPDRAPPARRGHHAPGAHHRPRADGPTDHPGDPPGPVHPDRRRTGMVGATGGHAAGRRIHRGLVHLGHLLHRHRRWHLRRRRRRHHRAGRAESWDGATWSAPSVYFGPATGAVTSQDAPRRPAVTCTTGPFCVIVDGSDHVSNGDGTNWIAPTALATARALPDNPDGATGRRPDGRRGLPGRDVLRHRGQHG